MDIKNVIVTNKLRSLMSEEKIVRPRHIGCTRLNGCDVCGVCEKCQNAGRDSYVHNIDNDIYHGWLSCECEPCIDTIERMKRMFLYPQKKLQEEFEKGFCVLRSNGKYEFGTWKFVGDGLRSHPDSEEDKVFVKIEKDENGRRMEKTVSLKTLRDWNRVEH